MAKKKCAKCAQPSRVGGRKGKKNNGSKQIGKLGSGTTSSRRVLASPYTVDETKMADKKPSSGS